MSMKLRTKSRNCLKRQPFAGKVAKINIESFGNSPDPSINDIDYFGSNKYEYKDYDEGKDTYESPSTFKPHITTTKTKATTKAATKATTKATTEEAASDDGIITNQFERMGKSNTLDESSSPSKSFLQSSSSSNGRVE